MEHWEKTLEAIDDHVHRLLLVGPKGTGKTSAAFELARRKNRPIERITLCQGMFSDALNGKYVLRNGSTEFEIGPAARAVVAGGVLLLDEVNKAGVEIISTLRAYLDDHAVCRMTLDNGDVITPEEGYRVVATMNGSPAELDEPLLDRFDVILHCDKPSRGLLAQYDPDVRRFVENLASNQPTHDRWFPPVSFRRLLALQRLGVEIGKDRAASIIFGEEGGRELVRGLVDAERNAAY